MKTAELIVRDPNIRFGKPTVVGTRITVADVLGWLAAGETIEDLLDDYPRLTKEGILACLAYAADQAERAESA
jgi:uncharacterized protein (DUF433 family)